MEIYSNWSSALDSAFSQLIERLAQSLPNLIGAIILLAVGWYIAKLLRSLTIRFTQFFDKLVHRFTSKRGMERAKVPSTSPQILGGIIFWVVVLFFVTAATHVLDLELFSAWLNRVIAYIPTLLAGGLIILAGVMVSSLARDLIIAAVSQLPPTQRVLLGRMVYLTILITSVVIGADQIGVDITFLVILLSVISGTFLGGIALAVSLGSKTVVSNVISAHYLKQVYRVGQTVRIGEFEGKIMELTNTAIVLETADGLVTIPAKLASENAMVLLLRSDTDG
jgi:small-conductance mechanosensitive channel